jgi:hypothetical protein
VPKTRYVQSRFDTAWTRSPAQNLSLRLLRCFLAAFAIQCSSRCGRLLPQPGYAGIDMIADTSRFATGAYHRSTVLAYLAQVRKCH